MDRPGPNPDEQQPINDEFSVTLERELMNNFAVRVTGVYSRYTNVLRQQQSVRPYSAWNSPITRPDPGDDGRVGTADDPGRNITFYEYPVALRGKAFEQNMMVNDPNADQHYTSIDVGAFNDNPFHNGFVPGGNFSRKSRRQPSIPTRKSTRPDTGVERGSKVSGAYVFPHGIMASANFESRSGNAWARQVLFTGGQTITTIVLNTEPIGTRQLPTIHLMDARVEKNFKIGTKQVAGRINVYNLLNKNTTTALNMRAGATFLRPTTILEARIVELSASFSF